MKCQRCKKEFEEKDIQLSHDVPKYIGGLDKDGRHNLCKDCHDIYEKMCWAVISMGLSNEQRQKAREDIFKFNKRFFNGSNT